LQVKYNTGTEINPQIWIQDPPYSSIPACMAVKCAEMQSAVAGDVMLQLLRKAVMLEGKNIASTDVIFEVAKQVESTYGILNYVTFITDWESDRLRTLIKEDFQKVKLNDIGRFPTLTIQAGNGTGVILVGYRPYNVLIEGFTYFTEMLKNQKVNQTIR
jgi:putative protein-disulfide isomerase